MARRGGAGAGGGRGGRGARGGSHNPPRKRGAPRARGGGSARSPGPAVGSYYMQPAKRGAVVVLHRPVGNRLSPKVCGVMPSRNHAKALVDQLRRAESALHDLFYEATDDGIEALDAVLAACREAVLTRMPVDSAATNDELKRERERIQAELDAKVQQRRAV
jgi:hypothetical protein